MTEEKSTIKTDHDYNWMLIIAPGLIVLLLGFVLPLRIFGIVMGLALLALGVAFAMFVSRRGRTLTHDGEPINTSFTVAGLVLIAAIGIMSITLFAFSSLPWTR